MATWIKVRFLDGSSFLIEYMLKFHDHSITILVVIMTLVGYMIIALMFGSFISKSTLENQIVEMLWTVFPGFVLVFIALPSLRVLYLTDEVKKARIALRVLGHQ